MLLCCFVPPPRPHHLSPLEEVGGLDKKQIHPSPSCYSIAESGMNPPVNRENMGKRGMGFGLS